MTLRVIYHAEKNKPTPGQVFIQKLADATCREAATVRMGYPVSRVGVIKSGIL